MSAGAPDVVDVVGVGFGPANLALAIALREHADEGHGVDAVFFEAQPAPAWHEGMLLEGASMQISFLKDLVTFRNPHSPFSFVSFLHEHGRLVDFTNRGSFEPLRVEFAAYLRWAASAFADLVHYGARVERIVPVRTASDGAVDAFEVVVASADGVRTVRARTVVVAAGLQPRFPDGVASGARVWHSAEYLHRVGALTEPRRLAVIGTGQSAMEVALDLSDRFPDAVVHVVSSQFGVGPSDQGPLVNGIFDPATVDLWYGAPEDVRTRLDRTHRNANNGVASMSVISAFHDRQYHDAWLGRERLILHRASRVVAVEDCAAGARLRVRAELEGVETELAVDAVVCGTGYRPLDTAVLLGADAAVLRRDSEGRAVLGRDHVAELTEPGDARLVLVGQGEHRHGLTSTLLSTVAVRAGEIADVLVGAVDPAVKGSHVPV